MRIDVGWNGLLASASDGRKWNLIVVRHCDSHPSSGEACNSIDFGLRFHHLSPSASSFGFALLIFGIKRGVLLSVLHFNSMLTLCHVLACLSVHAWSRGWHKVLETMDLSLTLRCHNTCVHNIRNRDPHSYPLNVSAIDLSVALDQVCSKRLIAPLGWQDSL